MKKYLNSFGSAHWLFLVLALLFGVCYAKSTPPLWGLDEPSHFNRAYLIAHGHFLLEQQNNDVPSNLIDLGNYAVGDLVDNTDGGIFNRADVRNREAYAQYMQQSFSTEKTHPSEIAGYSPVAYVGPVLGVTIADIFHMNMGHTILLARLGSLILYSALIFITIWLLRTSKLKWIFLATALLPTSLFQGSVVSADGMLISVSLLFLAILVRLIQNEVNLQIRRWLWVGIISTAIILPFIKFNYIFLTFGIFLIPPEAFGKYKKYSVFAKVGIVLVAALIGLLWVKEMGGMGDTPSLRSDKAIVSSSQQLSGVLHHPLHFIEACIRSLIQYGDGYAHTLTTQVGWNYVDLPFMFTFAAFASILIAALYAKDELLAYRRKFTFLGVLSIVGVVSIFGALYLVFTPVGGKLVDGVQGRYLLPFLIPIVLAVVVYLPINIKIKKQLTAPLFVTVSFSILLMSIISFIVATY